MNIVKSSLKYPQITLSVLLLIFIIGINSLLNMPRREDPKITIRTGLVVAYYPGANSAQVEEQVTKKLEQYLFQFEEIRKEKTYSTTRDGVVIINVELQESLKQPDIFWNKLRNGLLVAKAQNFPKEVIGPIVNSDFGDTEALVIGIESNTATFSQLKEYAIKIEDALRTIKSVSKIKRIGEQKEQILVTSNSQKLIQYGINLPQAIQILQSQNTINPSGNVKTTDADVPLYTTGYYTTENEVASQIIGASATGEIVRLKDVATIERIYEEPKTITTVNGNKAIILAVEMQEGNNIVAFGKEVKIKLADAANLIPSDVKISTIVNQPEIVDANISNFIHEFFLAIISVVIVVIVLLPFRIAAVAATAIPVTVAVTFALLHVFDIELHQVSLAALIVVLGMVVDDAIVIADNYVKLLDEGVDRKTAAWRSATELVVPVLTATVTIIAAFVPMIILTGSVGEFIFSLPVTVTIALASSFIIAMVLTPLLCYTFIKKGLHDTVKEEKPKKTSMLDRMQNGYEKAITWCMKYPKITIISSLLTIVLAGLLFTGIKQKFFPAAERNQFVIDLWMPTGTKLEETEKAILKIQKLIQKEDKVTSFATFIGTSAPRFYYNFSPEVPATNFAQILINTTTDKTTEELASNLESRVAAIVPEGMPHVRLMQQGSPTIAPIEIRIIGNNINELKEIGTKVKQITQKEKGSFLVRSDFAEDYYGIKVHLKDEANRLGFTTTSIAQLIYIGFSGAPVSTMYEGDNAIDILFRLDKENRQNSDNLANFYVKSPVTEASVPLRQIATLTPEWETGKIMHRNGVRTLTILSETTPDYLPSEVLKKIQPEIAKLKLPTGYRIEYGGEDENKKETFSQMIVALSISLGLIFFILLFQFRNLKEAFVVMLSIPLSIFGALLGLLLTNNNFGFTAFIGLISLSGIVVRNAIILVDHTNELLKEGMDIPTASIESAKRRLRPIFLTSMAASIGVLPMILSGSPMWSPLASVISIGVLFSMVMTLLVIPVIYVVVMKPKDKQEIIESDNAENNE